MSIRDFLGDAESKEFVEAVEEFPGPFIPMDTPKNVVVSFASRRAQLCRERGEAAVTKSEGASSSNMSADMCEDEALLWGFLVLLCQQNGVVVPSDVADLLVKDLPLTFKSSSHLGAQGQQESLDSLRNLLISGRKKDALDFACSKSLWGHALMLASRMDDQSRTYVVNRFTASLLTTDPLNTFYTLLIGRTPSSVKPEGLSRAGDWRPHLSMILANKTSELETASIVSLGDSLMSRKRLHAAHLCYYLADVHFGSYGDLDTRYSLLGVDHTELKTGMYPQLQDLCKMEVFEYAMSLTKQDFAMPAFQVFKLLRMLKLAEYGFLKRALKYCEQVSRTVMKQLDRYLPVFLKLLVNLSIRLHHFTSDFGYIETELPSWLYQLQRSVDALLSTGYTPNVLSPSPAFSSVSQAYSSHNTQPQLVIGLQQDAAHLTVPQVPKGVPPHSTSDAGGMGVDDIPPNEEGFEYYHSHANKGASNGLQQAMPEATQLHSVQYQDTTVAPGAAFHQLPSSQEGVAETEPLVTQGPETSRGGDGQEQQPASGYSTGLQQSAGYGGYSGQHIVQG
jgi:hypothetical protein